MTWRKYDETIPTSGIECSQLLAALRAEFGDDRVGSVSGPWSARDPGEQVHVWYDPDLAGAEVTTADAIYAAHDGSQLPAGSFSIMLSSDPSGEIPVGAVCVINTSGEAATRTLPPVAQGCGCLIQMRCEGNNDLTISPHGDDQGVTAAGGASLVMAGGDEIVVGVGTDGNWHLICDKRL